MDKMGQNRAKREFKYMAYHYEAIELRYQGMTYEEISVALGTKYNKEFQNKRLRAWFASKGILERMYMDFAKKENDRRRQVVLEEIKKITSKIPKGYADLIKTLEGNLVDPKSAGVFRQTLKDLCEILGFKVEPTGDGSNPLDDFFDKQDEELGLKKDIFDEEAK